MMESKVIEAVEDLANSVKSVGFSITNVGPGKDATGGYVGCLTEAVVGMTSGLVDIANAIRELADAVRESKGS